MKKAVIFVFSGTGNTLKIANLFKEEFERNSVATQIKSIEESVGAQIDVAGYDFIGIAYPIHAFNAPPIVLKFADGLPAADKKAFFILKTSGEPLKLNNISSLRLLSKLARKGYVLTNEYHYAMPYNMIFRHSDEMAFNMWRTAKLLAPVEAREILRGEAKRLQKVPMGRPISFAFRIEHPAMRLNGRFFKVDYDKCILCGKCARECPVGNIKLVGGRIEFGGDCVCCVRCSFNCPEDAISIAMLNGWKVNGAYDMENPVSENGGIHDNYCKKSYDRYFSEAFAKIESNKT